MYWRAEPTNLRGTFRSCKFTSETKQQFDRTSNNGFKLPQGWFKLDIRKKPYTMRLVKHGHVAQRDGGCPIPGNIHVRVGCGWATWSRWRCSCSLQGVGPGDLQRTLPNLTTLWFSENLSGWHWRNKGSSTSQKQPVHCQKLLQREKLSNSSHTLLLHPYEFFHNLIYFKVTFLLFSVINTTILKHFSSVLASFIKN